MALVEVKDLQVRFGEKTAVSAASFGIEKGETFSLIGASGCGKSTILRVLAGLQREWRGSVDLLGQAITPGARFQGELRRNVQMVFQDPYASLHPNHTLWRTLAEPLQIHGIRDVAPRVTTALEQVGLAAGELYAVQIHLPAKVGIHPLGEFGNSLCQAGLCKAVIDFYSVDMLGGLGNTFRNGGIQNGKSLKYSGKQAVIRAAVKFTNILPV